MTINLSLTEVHDIATQCLVANGCDTKNAEAVAGTVTDAERDLCHSHGLFRIPGYCKSLKSGKVNGKAEPRMEALAPGVLRVDANGGFAPLAINESRPRLIELAREQGIAATPIVNMFHFAALWPETERLADEGLVAIACCVSNSSVAPAGGTKRLFGTNPLSFAWPRKSAPPLVFDQASAAMARGEIQIAARDGHSVPEGTGIDAAGNPTTNPAEILEGAQLAYGGYKGAAIALMVECLAGGLIGDYFSFEATENDNKDGGPTRHGELIIAMDPARFGDPAGFLDHGEKLFARILEQEGTRLSSDRRYASRHKTPSEGTTIPRSLYDTLMELISR